MTKGRRFRLGALLIVVGAALIALNLWFLSSMYSAWVPSLGHRGYAAPGIVGLALLIAGVMVLFGC